MAKIKIKKEIRYHGAVVVETAIVLTLLLYLTLGVIEYGWAFLKSQQITNAARQAVRAAIRPDATEQNVTNVINDLLGANGEKIIHNGTDYDVIITLPEGESWNTLEGGEHITVEIKVPYAKDEGAGVVGIAIIKLPLFLPTPQTLEAAVTMAKEGSYVEE